MKNCKRRIFDVPYAYQLYPVYLNQPLIRIKVFSVIPLRRTAPRLAPAPGRQEQQKTARAGGLLPERKTVFQ